MSRRVYLCVVRRRCLGGYGTFRLMIVIVRFYFDGNILLLLFAFLSVVDGSHGDGA